MMHAKKKNTTKLVKQTEIKMKKYIKKHIKNKNENKIKVNQTSLITYIVYTQ